MQNLPLRLQRGAGQPPGPRRVLRDAADMDEGSQGLRRDRSVGCEVAVGGGGGGMDRCPSVSIFFPCNARRRSVKIQNG